MTTLTQSTGSYLITEHTVIDEDAYEYALGVLPPFMGEKYWEYLKSVIKDGYEPIHCFQISEPCEMTMGRFTYSMYAWVRDKAGNNVYLSLGNRHRPRA